MELRYSRHGRGLIANTPLAPILHLNSMGSAPFAGCGCSCDHTGMASEYLLKTEPSEYSFEDLQRDKTTTWDGVTNPVAVRNLREMEAGARLVIYHTGEHKSAVGTAAVVSVDAADLKKPVVKIKVGKALAKPVSLEQIKANKLFADSPLVKIGRLSVVPLTKPQYKFLMGE